MKLLNQITVDIENQTITLFNVDVENKQIEILKTSKLYKDFDSGSLKWCDDVIKLMDMKNPLNFPYSKTPEKVLEDLIIESDVSNYLNDERTQAILDLLKD